MSASSDREYVINHFSLSLPNGEGQGNVPELLRHLAAQLDTMKGAEIMDITFHPENDENGNDWPSFTVYYHRADTSTD